MSDVFGIRELQLALDKVLVEVQTASKRIVKRSEMVVEAEAKKQFTGAHKRGTPTTSAPGSPPDVVTGTLRRSIKSSPVQVNGLVAKGSVYPTAVYARIQELGGPAGRGGKTNLPARPYMTPAHDKALPAMRRVAAEEWAKALPL